VSPEPISNSMVTALRLPKLAPIDGDELDWFECEDLPEISHVRYGTGKIIRHRVHSDGFSGDVIFNSGLCFKFRRVRLPAALIPEIKEALLRG
jgi:hypothetical protein